jgi:dihydrofolate synthase/folylpolyglutamate synthase
MDLQLARLRPVAQRLALVSPDCPLISVAGTNGKGSTVAFLEALGRAAGMRVGSYGSPHLLRYAECVRLDGEPRADAEIVAAFETVERARAGVPLTPFEFRTLAAIVQLTALQPDLMVLEVGLGGRLDAVNVMDADVAVITSIGLDHQQWLGAGLPAIAAEKAGIARARRPLVCADAQAAALVSAPAHAAGARLIAPGRGLTLSAGPDAWSLAWRRWQFEDLPLPALPGAHQIRNAAAAVVAFGLTGHALATPSRALLCRALAEVRLAGRLQRLPGPDWRVVDVAHNPQAATALGQWLMALRPRRRWRAVVGVYRDKDLSGILQPLTPQVCHWHLAPLAPPRGASAAQLAAALDEVAPAASASRHASVEEAWAAAEAAASTDDGVLALGSFETVRRVLLTARGRASAV